MRMKCERCGAAAHTRSSVQADATHQRITFRCSETLCGHAFDVLVERLTSVPKDGTQEQGKHPCA